jgi:alpha-tubulin suppressor-like RCC1 family protein
MSIANGDSGAMVFVLENGRCLISGRHVLNPSSTSATTTTSPRRPRSSPLSLIAGGLELVPVVQASLGRTHLVAVGKNGALYTMGVNTHGQCGRPDPASTKEVLLNYFSVNL